MAEKSGPNLLCLTFASTGRRRTQRTEQRAKTSPHGSPAPSGIRRQAPCRLGHRQCSAFALFGHSRCPRQCLCAVWPVPLSPPVSLRCLAIPAVPASVFALFGHSRCPRQCLCAVWPFPLSPPLSLRCLAIPAVPAINCCISSGISGGRGGTCSASGARPQSMW